MKASFSYFYTCLAYQSFVLPGLKVLHHWPQIIGSIGFSLAQSYREMHRPKRRVGLVALAVTVVAYMLVG